LDITLEDMVFTQSLQCSRKLTPKDLCLELLPAVELGAVTEGEAGHEITLVDVRSLGQQGQAFGRGLP
jgi:hypothetical protein